MVNGVSLNDGNPIFQAYFPELKKALHIIQEEPLLPADFGSWVNVTEVAEEAVEELVVGWRRMWRGPERRFESGWMLVMEGFFYNLIFFSNYSKSTFYA